MLSTGKVQVFVESLTWCFMAHLAKRLLWLGLAASFTLTAQAEKQSVSDVEALVKDFVQAELDRFYENQADFSFQVGNLDKHIKLEECLEPLRPEAEFRSPTQHNFTVKVSCESPKKWALRVPVKVQLFKEIAVATQNIYKDQEITANDIKLVRTDISGVNDGYYASVDELIGLVVQRTLYTNTVIKHHMVKQPLLVRRGEMVKLVVRAPGLTIEGQGVAQTDGIKGQLIRIKNTRSNKIVEATVQDPGVAYVNL